VWLARTPAYREINNIAWCHLTTVLCYKSWPRFVSSLCFAMLVRLFRGRRSLLLENLALRQQLVALKRRHPRPRLDRFDALLGNRSAGLAGLEAVSHHRHARNHRPPAPDWFLYVLSADPQSPEADGRRPTPNKVRELIFRMVAENPTWGAPRNHGDLRNRAT
jgi:hypothetical protein